MNLRENELPFDEILYALEQGEIGAEEGMIRWSSNHTFLVNVHYENFTFYAIYKPRSGERPLWDFPEGTLCLRERLAFLTSEALGWRLIPPTVLREGERGLGSVQYFVEHDPEHHYFTFDASMLPQLATLALFDIVVNNADRKGGHCIEDQNGHLWGIDHGITFHMQKKLRTVIWNFEGEAILPNHLADLTAFRARLDDPQDAYTIEATRLLSPAEFEALQYRVDYLLKRGVYPRPGPGPNYPWPPI
jgi:hypothetical protein